MGRDEYGECDMVAWLRWLHEGKNDTATLVLGGMRRIMIASLFFPYQSILPTLFDFFFLCLVRSSLAPETIIVTSPLPGAQELYIDGLFVVIDPSSSELQHPATCIR